MKKSLFAFIAFLFIGCGGDKPEDVVKNMFAATKSCNFSKMEQYAYFPTDSIKEEMAEAISQYCDPNDPNVKNTEIIKTEIVSQDKDRAEVKIVTKRPDGDEIEDTATVLKVDGKWKVDAYSLK